MPSRFDCRAGRGGPARAKYRDAVCATTSATARCANIPPVHFPPRNRITCRVLRDVWPSGEAKVGAGQVVVRCGFALAAVLLYLLPPGTAPRRRVHHRQLGFSMVSSQGQGCRWCAGMCRSDGIEKFSERRSAEGWGRRNTVQGRKMIGCPQVWCFFGFGCAIIALPWYFQTLLDLTQRSKIFVGIQCGHTPCCSAGDSLAINLVLYVARSEYP